VNVRRGRHASQPVTAQPFPESEPTDVPWARQVSTPLPQATHRARHVVENLPDWEPLPPGEVLVRRPGQP